MCLSADPSTPWDRQISEWEYLYQVYALLTRWGMIEDISAIIAGYLFHALRFRNARFSAIYVDTLHPQTSVKTKMRLVLLDWMIEIQYYGLILDADVLYTGVGILDRYLSTVAVIVPDLQLTGICAMAVASKMCCVARDEEGILRDCVYFCDDTYSMKAVLEKCAELRQFVEGLDDRTFLLTLRSPLYYLERLLEPINRRIDRACYPIVVSYAREVETFEQDKNFVALCHYFLDMTLFSLRLLRLSACKIAAGVVYLVRAMMKKELWNEALYSLSTYSEIQAREFALEVNTCYTIVSGLVGDDLFSGWNKKHKKTLLISRDEERVKSFPLAWTPSAKRRYFL